MPWSNRCTHCYQNCVLTSLNLRTVTKHSYLIAVFTVESMAPLQGLARTHRNPTHRRHSSLTRRIPRKKVSIRSPQAETYRNNLFVLVRSLFQYHGRVASEPVKQCSLILYVALGIFVRCIKHAVLPSSEPLICLPLALFAFLYYDICLL